MKELIKRIPYNRSFLLPGEQGHSRSVMREVRHKGAKTEIYVAPFAEGRLFPTRGRWIDWNTEVELVLESDNLGKDES